VDSATEQAQPRPSGFYWIRHTPNSTVDIGYYNHETEGWTFCGNAWRWSDDDIHEVVARCLCFKCGVDIPEQLPNEEDFVPGVDMTGAKDGQVLVMQEDCVMRPEDPIITKTTTSIPFTQHEQEKLPPSKLIEIAENEFSTPLMSISNRPGKFVITKGAMNSLSLGQWRQIMTHFVVIDQHFRDTRGGYLLTCNSKLFDIVHSGEEIPEYKIRPHFNEEHQLNDLSVRRF
jgi:hypothetical protein